MITDNIPLLRSKGFNSPPLTTHRSTSKNGRATALNGKVCGMRMVLYEGSTPCFSLRLLSMRVPNIDGHPNAIVGKFRTLDVLGRVLVDLLHLTRRLGKPNLLPHRCTLWGFFAARARSCPADFYIIPHFKQFVKHFEPLF